MRGEAPAGAVREDPALAGSAGDRAGALLGCWLRAAWLPECPPWLRRHLAEPSRGCAQEAPGKQDGGLPDAPALFARAHAQGIAPILHASLERWGGEGAFSARLAPFGAAYRATLRHNVLLLDELSRIAARFSREEIETILLKGAALLLTVYPHPALRPMGDLDLLVREADVPRALRAAQDLGFRILRPGVSEARLRTKHEIALARRLGDGTPIYLEIHWRFIPRESLVAGPAREPEQIWRDSHPSEDLTIPARVLSAEDALVLGALHLQRHVYSRAIWFVDLAMLLERKRIDWDRVVNKAKIWGTRSALHLALRGLREICGVGAPREVMSALHPGRFRAAGAEAIVCWSNAFGEQAAHGEHALSPTRRYLLKLLQVRDTLGALAQAGRMLFPSQAWLRARYGLRTGASAHALRLRHLASTARTVVGATRR
jgi:hypothetical protein